MILTAGEFDKKVFRIIGDFETIQCGYGYIKIKAIERLTKTQRDCFYEYVYRNVPITFRVDLKYKVSKEERALTVFKRVWIKTFKKEIRLLIKITKVLNDWLQ